uniref:Alkaline phosphatase n=1 Tax=Rhipicephalus appendiculatus TaxID=34631 RepID=A0A131YZB2_RHIAP
MKAVGVLVCLAACVYGSAGFANPQVPREYESVPVPEGEDDPEFWRLSGQNSISRLLSAPVVDAPAKNVIVFVGDGMGISTVTASRIYRIQKGTELPGEEGSLSFEHFPYTALVKTYAVDRQVTDSAASATALFCGAKTKMAMLALSARANTSECDSAAGNELHSFIKKAQDRGMSTGLVTTTRVTHATPAALYAHSAHRDWEMDTKMPKRTRCKDIARQLVEDEPGRNMNVILGGGLAYFKDKQRGGGKRSDGLDLVDLWKKDKKNRKFVGSREELLAIDTNKTDYVLGLFSGDHMSYEDYRQDKQPSLLDMVVTAIEILRKRGDGFALMVEGGRIDHGHHENRAALALRETAEFSDAVAAALELVDLRETLVLVTADHSHAFTINGYPARGNPILGVAGVSEKDGLPYTTLSYANGPSTTKRKADANTEAVDYQQVSAVPLRLETHAGEDVALYAAGPMAHMVHGVLEQHTVAHLVDYAACLGDGARLRSRCQEQGASAAAMVAHSSLARIVIVLVSLPVSLAVLR